ncbi:hypothetical protein M9H77_27557 [Catharanthus roseus]|uniref:Uncharacterized protein n=1 Tax=Catharanthus roseus TaxID=4058 RepID=A0ACC0AD85_CATRO|nr:hypothetical protein M9H77_27557 [Catharanthus roseus]
MEKVPAHVHPGPIVPHLCTAALGGARQIGEALVLVQISAWLSICIAASANYDCSGRPSCSSWRYMFAWLPYLDRALVLSDLWRAEVLLICYEIVEYHYPRRCTSLHGLSIYPMHVILVLTYIGSSLGGMTTLTGRHRYCFKRAVLISGHVMLEN